MGKRLYDLLCSEGNYFIRKTMALAIVKTHRNHLDFPVFLCKTEKIKKSTKKH